ncbi:hypothetical protein EVAR_46710_1 [Eumeta japonica]|uniref:Uncharacterized protein n=1 Tax=Eumeta variegata TaxID=151549 RepID=A0A4C1XC32_EUMVA|nr:hypothetical protein EVAR_46710_1 [Eumeta japonica]
MEHSYRAHPRTKEPTFLSPGAAALRQGISGNKSPSTRCYKIRRKTIMDDRRSVTTLNGSFEWREVTTPRRRHVCAERRDAAPAGAREAACDRVRGSRGLRARRVPRHALAPDR